MTVLTNKTRSVLAVMFRNPDAEWTTRDVAAATGLPPNVAGNLLARLISMEFVTDRRTSDGTRLFRLSTRRRNAAAAAAGVKVDTPPPPPSRERLVHLSRVPTASAEDDSGATVMTLSQVRALHQRGEVSAEFLRQVESAVAATVKTTRT